MQRIRSLQISFICVVLFFAFSTKGHAQLWSGVLSSSRATDWTKAGVPGGIPSGSWTQCGPTIQAYGSSGGYASPSTIINALNHTGSGYTSCGPNQYVLLGSGDFYLNAAIRSVGVSNQELRGSGPTQTRLHFSSGSTCSGGRGPCLISFESSDGTYASPTTNVGNWTGGYAQGSNSITLSSGASITPNSTMIVLDQCDTGYSGSSCSGSATDNGNYFSCEDAYNAGNGTGCSFNAALNSARPHRGQQEMVEVSSCNPACGGSGATTVTITPALRHPNWSGNQTPQFWLIQPARNVGVTNLLVDGSATNYSDNVGGVAFNNDAYFWVQNVAIENMPNVTLYVAQSIHGDIEHNYLYNSGQSNPNSDNSGINYFGSNNLIANNIIHNAHIGVIGNGSVSGNVVAYNYIVNAFSGNSILVGNIWPAHSNGADYNLYEGNVGTMYNTDQTHGNGLMNTLYRNFFTGWESCANGNCGSNNKKTDDLFAILQLGYNRYANFVGNILGTPGVSTTYNYTNPEYYFSGPGTGYVWSMGSGNQANPSGGYAGGPIPVDPLTASSALRWGNWDATNNSTQWNTNEVPSGFSVYPNSVPSNCTNGGACPPSFYLPSRPSWWSASIPFPAMGPDVSNGNVGQCSGTPNTPGQYAGVAAMSGSECRGTSLSSAWGGHMNATPAMACYLSTLGGPPDGTGKRSAL